MRIVVYGIILSMKRPLAIAALMIAAMLDMVNYGYPPVMMLSVIAVISFAAMIFAAIRLNRWYLAPAVTSIGFALLLIVLVNTPCPNR